MRAGTNIVRGPVAFSLALPQGCSLPRESRPAPILVIAALFLIGTWAGELAAPQRSGA